MTSYLSPLLGENSTSAYWNGFIMADGTFTGTGGNRLKIGLSSKDHSHLVAFASWIGRGQVRQYKNSVSEWAVQDPIAAPLIKEKFDIHPRKTYNPPSRLPFKDHDLLRSWLVGFIDGDGCVKRQTGRQTALIDISLHLSWLPFLNMLSECLGLGTVSIREKEYARLTISRHNDVTSLKKFALREGLPILNRKWDRVDESIVLDRHERVNRVKALIKAGLPNKEIIALTGATGSSISNIRLRSRLKEEGEIL